MTVDPEAHVHDHPFDPPPERRWDRCRLCGLGQVAHDDPGEPYEPTAPKATPEVTP